VEHRPAALRPEAAPGELAAGVAGAVLNAEALRRAGIMVWLKPRVTDSLLLVQLQTMCIPQ
jgi:hypothetical protein